MKTNLIQNYINSRPMMSSTVQQEPQKKQAPEFSIQEQLNNRTFIKPLKSKGKLVNASLFDAPAIFIKDTIYDIKSLKHGIDGTANDHELGKLNDLGLKTGGIAIASYLLTKRSTPQTKAMEFIGLGSFLASMAIWPKLAIQLPAYLVHGVNVHKEYKDSFGRKKPFYQDPQFIPWDLYSDKEIDKIGDRLGVPRNINNRRDFIQEKMKKIAVQSNTLWMLTAGFATPIMSALMCKALEQPVLDFQNGLKNKKAKALLTDFDKNAKNYRNDDILNNLNNIINQNKEAVIDEKLLNKISETLTEGLDPISAKAFKQDLAEMLLTDDYTFLNTSARELSNSIKKTLISEEFSEEIAEMITPNEVEFANFMKENNMLNSQDNVGKERELISKLFEPIKAKIEAYNATVEPASRITEEEISEIRGMLVSKKGSANPFKQVFAHGNKSVLNQDAQASLRNLANIMGDFKSQLRVLDEYAFIKVASAPETNIAYHWNKAADSLIKTLGISDKELEKARFDRELMNTLIQDRIGKIAADKNAYNTTMTNLIDTVAKLDFDINVDALYNEKVDSVFTEFSNNLAGIKRHPMTNFRKAVDGLYTDASGQVTQLSSCLKELQKQYVNNRLLGVKSSFYRLINTMDMYKRMSTLETASVLNDTSIPREIKEEIAELCQHIMTQGHSSDFAIKFYHLRNSNPNLTDMDNIVMEGGKLKRKYGIPLEQRVDIPQDCQFFQRVMKVMFGEELHPDTLKILESKNLSQALAEYRTRMMQEVGGDSYFAKPFHMTENSKPATSKTKFLLTGIAPDELLYKVGKQTYNTRKWLKMFGGFGAGLLGVTVLSQFFFGKMKLPQRELQTSNKGQ